MSMFPAVLALLASVGYGTGSVLSRSAVRGHTASSLALWVQFVGLIALGVLAVIVPPVPSTGAVLWGLLAGALAACGVLTFYTAMQNGPISLVAPVSASGVAIPVLGGVLLGEQVSLPAFFGIALIGIGVLIIARSHARQVSAGLEGTSGGLEVLASAPGRSQVVPVHDNCKPSSFDRPYTAAIVLACASAGTFGLFYLALGEAAAAAASASGSTVVSASEFPAEAAVLVALAVQIGSLVVTLVTASPHTIRCVAPSRNLFVYAGAIGLVDVGGDLALTYAIASGPTALVGPLGSLSPIFAVLLAAAFFGDALTPRRALGLCVCALGIALVAL